MIHEHRAIRIRPRRLAAPARVAATDEANERSLRIEPCVHELCDRWGLWFRTRRYFAPPSNLSSVLGKLRARSSGICSGDGPNARLDAELAAFHTAWLALHGESRREQVAALVFRLHFVERASPVKQVAKALGIGRQHYHALVAQTARLAYAAHWRIMEARREVSPPEATK